MREKILSIIQNDSRMQISEIAAMIGKSEEEVSAEIEKMEKEHIICGYHTIINWEKAGSDKVSAIIEVSVTPGRDVGFDDIAAKIYRFKEVTSVYLVSGSFDLLVTVEGEDLKDVAQFVAQHLSAMESVLSCKTNFVLKRYKEHNAILEKGQKDERVQMLS